MKIIDLRSDTVTQPTPAMREAMAKAPVGDDVYGEDPTVNALEELAAAKVGKEAGLFVPSGTMGNLIAMLSHCGRGDEIILGKRAHTFLYEGGGISTLGSVHSAQVWEQADGSIALEDIEAAVRPDDVHAPRTRLVALENTHNRCGGTFQPPAYMAAVGEFAHARGLRVHVDGARIFNAAVAQNVDVKALTGPVDSVTFCLSKGLCAPVGSVLCGSRAFIAEARRWRKHLGGGMRQAGILAAAGIVSLNEMVERLAEDHARARRLAGALSMNPKLVLDSGSPATNMLFMNLSNDVGMDAAQTADALRERGVLVGVTGARRFRLVLHYWIDDKDVERVVSALGDILT
ncbi:MAG: low-specificity L-threonine aldolase [Chloroflexi bacterium HGW-Chloroflexi-6]|nr:MAG: low-specificity L-threonine aldolase [Chloroflexi bacterium HGW-Chloroflexi-6]